MGAVCYLQRKGIIMIVEAHNQQEQYVLLT